MLTKERKGIMIASAAIIAAGCHGVFQFAAFAFTMSLRSSRIRSPRVRRVKAGFVALRLRYHDKRSAITITAIAVLSAAETADFTIARRRRGEHFYRAWIPFRHRYNGRNLSLASIGSPWTIIRNCQSISHKYRISSRKETKV